MNILFCDNPLDNKAVDPDFADEFAAAKENGFTAHLFSFEKLTQDENALASIGKVKPHESLRTIIYRGWMLKPKQYSALYEGLLSKNFKLINSPTEYQNCYYLPDSYRFIKEYMPETVWLSVRNQQVDYKQVFGSMALFADSPVIVKDFVKSQKHYWETACYIPSASDENKVKAVIEKFVKLQGADLNEGLIIREFVALNDLSIHSKTRMPLKQEYRLFFLNGCLIGCYDYWEEGEYDENEQPPLDVFKGIARCIESNLFSMDIAKAKSGDWIIIELGDGQVAGLPDNVDKQEFYRLARQYYGS